jgi:dTDP-4-dehydrorhamnose reductase
MRRKLPVTIVHDEYRSAVWASDLAQRVIQLAGSDEIGIRHVFATRAVSRVELADYLLSLSGIAPEYQFESRHQRATPHLGTVELASRFRGALFAPLQSAVASPGNMDQVRLRAEPEA